MIGYDKARGRNVQHQPFKVMHWNADGVFNKKTKLQHILHEKDINVCLIQETQLHPAKSFKIRGYQCFRCDRIGRRIGGIMALVRNNINATQAKCHKDDSVFQSFSKLGYDHVDRRGEKVKTWQDDDKLNLINQPEDPPTFCCGSWQTTLTPDLAFCRDDIQGHFKKEVSEQLESSDHRSVHLIMDQTASTFSSISRWNYERANWTLYHSPSDDLCKNIRLEGRDIKKVVINFNSCIPKATQKAIPSGTRKYYKPYCSEELEGLQTKLSEARMEAETNPTQETNLSLQQASTKFLRHKLEAQRKRAGIKKKQHHSTLKEMARSFGDRRNS